MTDAGTLFLLEKEGGLVRDIYYDCASNPTIGVGHLMTEAELVDYKNNRDKWDEPYLMHLFESDLNKYKSYISDRAKDVNLTPNQFAALVSWSFNCGRPQNSGIWEGFRSSPIDYVHALNTLCQYTGVGEPNSLKGPARWRPLHTGLMNRRFDEVVLFLRDMRLTDIAQIFSQLRFKDGSQLRRMDRWHTVPIWLTDMPPDHLTQLLSIVGQSLSTASNI